MKANRTFLVLLLVIFSNVALYSQLTSNLPIVIINTGEPIPDEPKIMADMGIIYNGPGMMNSSGNAWNHYNGKIGIELRGSSSSSFLQKSYSIETRSNEGTNLDVPLLGMPLEHDWVLHAPYTDKSLLRNVLTYQLWNEMGHYGPRTRFVELILNGEYLGVYVLLESIKRDNDRVDISKLLPTDISGDNLTGGYIIKIDKTTGGGTGWTSPYLSPAPASKQISILHHYPKSDEIVSQQATYIQNFMTAVENTLAGVNFTNPTTGYRGIMSINSFIDYLIVNEISKNVDGYRISSFFHKDKSSKGGKLKAGPVWDYNIAWWNADYCQGNSYTGWSYNFPTACSDDSYQVPFWWSRMMQDPYFVNLTRCRYEELRASTLQISKLHAFIDAYALDTLNAAQTRHFAKWGILGTYVWPNPNTPPAYSTGSDNEIKNLKTWITNRLTWMDANLPGNCALLPVHLTQFKAKRDKEEVVISWKTISEREMDRYVVEYSMDGNIVWEAGEVFATNVELQTYSFKHLSSLEAIYRLKMISNDGSVEYSEWEAVDGTPEILSDFEAYPNPFSESISFGFEVRKATPVEIELLNSTGNILDGIKLSSLLPGHYTQSFPELQQYPAGTYLIKIRSEKTVLYRKVIKL